MSIRLGRSLCFLALGWIASACVSDAAPEAACESVGSPSVVVTVRDSTSGQAAADGAIGTLVGAGVDDTLTRTDSLTLIGGNQTGTYTVTIDRPGYRTWTAINIRVTEIGPCGQVIPVQLNARLQRETP
jgi:hypothetical protein